MLKLNMVSHNHKIKIDQKTIHNTQSQFVVCSYIHIFLRWFFRKEKLDDILCHTQRDQVDGTQNSTLNWNRQPNIIWYYVRYNKTSFVIASWKKIYMIASRAKSFHFCDFILSLGKKWTDMFYYIYS